jgi:hypothetical protein
MNLAIAENEPVVVPLPVSDIDRRERLALRIAGSIGVMGLNTCQINACVRIGLVCIDQGYTLIGAYDHAVKVARRIMTIKQHTD